MNELSWTTQHELCNAVGRATPGSSATGSTDDGRGYQDEHCAYSPSDNYVVTDQCQWHRQEFTRVSGSLEGGVGYMCAGSTWKYRLWRTQKTDRGDITFRTFVRVTLTATPHNAGVRLKNGDAVFCASSESII